MPQISKGQLAILLINVLIPTAHIQVLLNSIKYAGHDAWLAVSIGYIIALGIVLLSLKLMKRYPKQNILDFSSQILGSFLGKLIAFILFIYSFLVVVYVLEQFIVLITTMIYGQSSPMMFRVSLMALVVYSISLGVEGFFRTSSIIFSVVALITPLIAVGLLQQINFNLVFPILVQNPASIIRGAIVPSAFLGNAFLILFFNDLVDRSNKVTRVITIGLSVGFLFVASFVVVAISVFGVDLASKLFFIPFMITRLVKAGEMLLRQEIFMLVVWMGLIFVQLTTFFWISCTCLTSLFNLKNKKKYSIPLALLIINFASIGWDGIIELQNYVESTYSMLLIIIQVTIPLLLYIVAVVRGKNEGADK
ncbi:spore germination protein, amino acid permease [Halobacteroides halobius DSM 5150]|uniref:Spore germination protein, amino acid permease n=1 Tax=Halobacteroides halobius (strain ATCC 35273 / DSM 5150 / MD-1) TaxID=748449 RepID=L0KD15_HALHC|nr:endospore germination permease [Halobacteroides halobius]AGB42435.1 spore germination protein, amino acid permease [Halobacteroides halobius DSM 5150]